MALQGKHILLGISGGIAAYKIPELIRSLVKEGAEVRVATTQNALQFVTELTLQTLSGSKVYSDVFAAINDHSTEHISLPDWCDVLLVAPCTANVLCKTAAGIADDALTTTICSCVARKPVLIAPAMNDKMWENPAVQNAVNTIRQWEKVQVLEPEEGLLACGTCGKGRMPEIETLQEAIEDVLTPKTLTGKRVLITAGGTQEKIDPVRFISNYSTGKMGFALAHECARRGAAVTLVCGAVTQQVRNPFGRIQRLDTLSAQEMYEACMAQWPQTDIAILSAAVADFKPAQQATEKIKKETISNQKSAIKNQKSEISLPLTHTPDIAAALGAGKQAHQTLIGFALETEHEKENALRKLERKNLDAIVLNSLREKGAGFGTDTNRVTILRKKGQPVELPLQSKKIIAAEILTSLFS